MLDWEGRIATTVFVAGCNFSCPYCHNPELVSAPTHPATIPFSKITEHLVAKRKWLDAVVVSGGEPTLYEGLGTLAERVRQIGMSVKIDTNGSRPDVLDRLLCEGLVDCVAMDIKTSFERYGSVARRPISIEAIQSSIRLVIDSGIRHEFRTTVMPGCVEREDALEIASGLTGADKYVLQQFNPKVVLDPAAADVEPYSGDFLRDLAAECSKFVPTTVRGAA